MSRQDSHDRLKTQSIDPCGAQITKEIGKKMRRTKKSQKRLESRNKTDKAQSENAVSGLLTRL